MAENLTWPKEPYFCRVFKLERLARFILSTTEQSSNYDAVKELILRAYELVPKPTDKNLGTI